MDIESRYTPADHILLSPTDSIQSAHDALDRVHRELVRPRLDGGCGEAAIDNDLRRISQASRVFGQMNGHDL
jgi:hypothetical protein